MGWRINLVANELALTEAMKTEIEELPDHIGASVSGDKLYFNGNHLEHMDYVWTDEVTDILTRNGATGSILFSSSEGDNRGSTWGYRFEDGELTKMTRLNGEWVPTDEVPEGTDTEVQPTGNRPDFLVDAKIGDTVAIGFIYAGLTSYEEETVGDILPDGALVVNGREFRAPDYRSRDDMATFVLKSINDPSVDLEEEDEMEG